MEDTQALFVFILDDWHYALPLAAMQRVIPRVEITPLPQAPAIVLGVINLQGAVVPVVDIRRRFRLPQREAELSDPLIVAQTMRRTIAFAVDGIQGLLNCQSEAVMDPDQIVQGMEYVAGVLKIKEGILFIHDLDRFLSLEEEILVSDALRPPEPNQEGTPC